LSIQELDATRPASAPDEKPKGIWSVIAASSAGTVIEWYDFYIFGALAATVSPKFYPEGDKTLALMLYLLTFAVGFIVRPFGAVVFGHVGDKVGRKYAFLVTLLIMGGATAAIGLIPSYAMIGVAAPLALVLIRILQGLALGGEYGGAAIYVAEHVSDKKRGFYTSFIQITATLGLFVSLGVILITKGMMSKEAFDQWGWRIPFLLSSLLVLLSLVIRLRMSESPLFSQLKSSGKTAENPLKEAFSSRQNLKRIALTLFGLTAGQAVVWYTGQFYALFYLKSVLKVEDGQANTIVAVALLFAMPFFVIFGALSDRIGRKRLMLGGMVLAAVSWLPIYHAMVGAAGTDVVAVANTTDPLTNEIKLIPQSRAAEDMTIPVPGPDGTVTERRVAAGELYPAPQATDANVGLLIFLVFVQVLFVCMVYGPIAAYLVEAFPARVRYTSMSLPYHLGNGIFGGLLPLIGLWICAGTGNIYAGLAYPIAVTVVTVAIGAFVLKDTSHVRIWDEIDPTARTSPDVDLTDPEPDDALVAS
jgi:MFS family permease